MTSVQPNEPPSDPVPNRRPTGLPVARPLTEGSSLPSAHAKPRVKMLATPGDLTPAGATYTPPTTAPLPERGAGIQLFLSGLAALVAMIFLFLLSQRL